MHLENPATTVLVAAPEVADVQLLASNVLYVIGKTVGRTSVAVLDDNGLVDEQVIAVVLDLEPLRTILAGEPDLIGVRASRLSRGIALTGEVVSAAAADRALRLATGALPDGVPIDNQLAVAAPQQVNLEVLIAEVRTAPSRRSWGSVGNRSASAARRSSAFGSGRSPPRRYRNWESACSLRQRSREDPHRRSSS